MVSRPRGKSTPVNTPYVLPHDPADTFELPYLADEDTYDLPQPPADSSGPAPSAPPLPPDNIRNHDAIHLPPMLPRPHQHQLNYGQMLTPESTPAIQMHTAFIAPVSHDPVANVDTVPTAQTAPIAPAQRHPSTHAQPTTQAAPRTTLTALAHYTSLIVAEHPLRAHRDYVRLNSAAVADSKARRTQPRDLGTVADETSDHLAHPVGVEHGTLNNSPGNSSPRTASPESSQYKAYYSKSSRPTPEIEAADSFVTPPEQHRHLPRRDLYEESPASVSTIIALETPVHARLQHESPRAELKKEMEDERTRAKSGFWYQVVRNQIVRSKRRRGRQQYALALKRIYRSLVPERGASSVQPLTTWQRAHDWTYVFLMVIFDRLTPVIVGGNRALVCVLLVTMLSVTQMFMSGQFSGWIHRLTSVDCTIQENIGTGDCHAYEHASFVLASPTEGPAAAFELHPSNNKTWGPGWFWDQRVGNNTRFPDQYVADWGASSPALLAGSGETGRLFSSFFVHRHWWHFCLLTVGALTACGFLERRYGSTRMVVMVIFLGVCGSMTATLAGDDCDLVMGVAPIAWGCLMWWAVDVAALMSFWVWKDTAKLKHQLSKWRNVSMICLLVGTFILLLATDASQKESRASSVLGGITPALLIAPSLVPRWRSSLHEALSVALAACAVIIYAIVVPVLTVSRLNSLDPATITCTYLLDP